MPHKFFILNSPAKILTSLTRLFLERLDVTVDCKLVNFSRRRRKAAYLGLLFLSPDSVRVA